MNKRTIYYTSAVAAPLLALGLVAAPVFAQENASSTSRPQLTAEQKVVLEQAHELGKQGKRDEARALLESAGLPARPMLFHRNARKQGRGEMQQRHAAVHEAIKNGDYLTFQELTKDASAGFQIDEAKFNVLVEASNLREAGDIEGAKALLDEAGIKPPHPGKKLGQRFHKGFRNAK